MADTIQVEPTLFPSIIDFYSQQQDALSQTKSYVVDNCTLDDAFGLLLSLLKPQYEDARDKAFAALGSMSDSLGNMATQVQGYADDMAEQEASLEQIIAEILARLEALENEPGGEGGPDGAPAPGPAVPTGGGGGGPTGGGGGPTGGGGGGPTGGGGGGPVPQGPTPDAEVVAPELEQPETGIDEEFVEQPETDEPSTETPDDGTGETPDDGTGLPDELEDTLVPGEPDDDGVDVDVNVEIDGDGNVVNVDVDVTVDPDVILEREAAQNAEQAEFYQKMWDERAAEDPLGRSADDLRLAWEGRESIEIDPADAAPTQLGYGDDSALATPPPLVNIVKPEVFSTMPAVRTGVSL